MKPTARRIRTSFIAVGALFVACTVWKLNRGLDCRNLGPIVLVWISYFAAVAFVTLGRYRVLLSISSLFLILGLAEIGILVHQEWVKAPDKKYSYFTDAPPGWIAEHGSVGYAFFGPVELLASATIGDDAIYQDVPYHIDGLSRRPCPVTRDAGHHALFFGGSFAFGEGHTNGQTLGCRFQEMSRGEYRSTTYAMMGWGPSQTLVQLGFDSLFSEVPQPSGIAVYSFLGDHIYRTTWKIAMASDYPNYPFFSLADDDTLIGPFKASDHPKLDLARDFFSFSREFSPAFRNLVNPSWFKITSDARAVVTTARVLGAARQRYQERFDGEFIVLLWPRSKLSPDLEELFVKELIRQNIVVIDVPPLPGDSSEAQLHPLDSHPSLKETTWVAEHLYGVLREKKPPSN